MLNCRRTIAVLLLSLFAVTAWADTEADGLYQQAQSSYADGHYQEALDTIQKAVQMQPDNSNYQHFLGKCYGRLAETANPLSALSLATKTRKNSSKSLASRKFL